MHNLYKVETEDSCEGTEAIVGGAGGQSMDEELSFSEAGTFTYACIVMCTDETAPGGTANLEHCHCSAYTHKLVVTVVDEIVEDAAAESDSTDDPVDEAAA